MRRFWLVALLVLGSAHLYIWSRLVAPLPSPWNVIATIMVVALAPTMPLARRMTGGMTHARAKPYLLVGFLWFGFATYLLLGAVASHIAVAFGVDAQTAALCGIGGAAATVIYGLVHVARGPQVRRVEIPLRGLPVDSYRIVQLTDVHIGPMIGAELATDVVQKVNALKADAVVITGDFVDGRLSELRHAVEPFRDLHARDGVFAVSGNHEYYWNIEPWLEHLSSLGIRILRNEHVVLANAVTLAGVDDSTATEDIPRAIAGRDPALPIVLLAHHPRVIARAEPLGVDLQLSGHTHGGQLLPLGWLARLFDPVVSGLARVGKSWLYVSEGTGFWGPPMRVGTTQEITAITLVPAK